MSDLKKLMETIDSLEETEEDVTETVVDIDESLDKWDQQAIENYVKDIIKNAPDDIKAIMKNDSKGTSWLVSQVFGHYLGLYVHQGMSYDEDEVR